MMVSPSRKNLDAVRVPTDLEVAWAAGIFEGEGTVRNCGRGKRSLAVAIVQKDPELLYWMKEMFGGNVGGPSNNCYRLDLCGDRARIFLAQIYHWQTARRKAQIDSAGALSFLGGQDASNFSTERIKSELLAYYEAHRETTWRGNAKVRKLQQAKFHAEKMQNDPAYREIRKARAAEYRNRPENKKAMSEYQKARYQRSKNPNVLEMEKAS